MKKLLLLLLTTLISMAIELPKSINTEIETVEKNSKVKLTQDIPKGMSGIVIHNYGNKLSAITHRVISKGGGEASVEIYDALGHEKIPQIKTAIKKGDKVIFGNLYNNTLLIAPNQHTYRDITKKLKTNWIHPDSYAMFLINNDQSKLSLDNLKKFSQQNQIGLVAIVSKKSLLILDPISGQYLSEEPIDQSSSEKVISPFYARFEQISHNIFSADEKKDFLEYYKGIKRLK